MTDKQIIIDGTDVSECKHFKIGTCLADYLLTDMNFSEAKCELCKNCYYKQLKRKEQECEELKKNVEHWKMEHKETKAKGEWTYDLVKKRLGQQLEQLKEENEECIKDNEYLKTIIKDFTQEVVKLKTTLSEIKEICRFNFTITTTNLLAKTILQKINECEV